MIAHLNQAYTRNWEAVACSEAARAEWFNAVSSLFAFCSKRLHGKSQVVHFQNLLVPHRRTSLFVCLLYLFFFTLRVTGWAIRSNRIGGRARSAKLTQLKANRSCSGRARSANLTQPKAARSCSGRDQPSWHSPMQPDLAAGAHDRSN